jgi:hypothetical protein
MQRKAFIEKNRNRKKSSWNNLLHVGKPIMPRLELLSQRKKKQTNVDLLNLYYVPGISIDSCNTVQYFKACYSFITASSGK